MNRKCLTFICLNTLGSHVTVTLPPGKLLQLTLRLPALSIEQGFITVSMLKSPETWSLLFIHVHGPFVMIINATRHIFFSALRGMKEVKGTLSSMSAEILPGHYPSRSKSWQLDLSDSQQT